MDYNNKKTIDDLDLEGKLKAELKNKGFIKLYMNNEDIIILEKVDREEYISSGSTETNYYLDNERIKGKFAIINKNGIVSYHDYLSINIFGESYNKNEIVRSLGFQIDNYPMGDFTYYHKDKVYEYVKQYILK